MHWQSVWRLFVVGLVLVVLLPQASSAQEVAPAAGPVLLVARHSGLCLDVQGQSKNDGADVIQWECNGQSNQLWALRHLGYGYFVVVNLNSGKCLDVAQSSTANGGDVIQWTCNGQANQIWRRVKTGPLRVASYSWVNANSRKCLDVLSASIDNGADVVQWDCNWGANQQWVQFP